MSIKIKSEFLIGFAEQLLNKGGFSAEESRLISQSLVESDQRGYHSHGVMRIPTYVTMLQENVLQSNIELSIVKESDALVVADGQWGVGQVQAAKLLEHLVGKVKQSGLAVGTMYQSGHIGRLGEYCESAAKHDLVSLVMVNSHGAVVRMSPPGSREPRLSTNPLAFGVPHDDSPLVADFSTSATAEGKVRVKKFAGEPVPAGWILNSSGNPTTDPNDLYTNPPGSILPMGGEQAYKGFALGLMVEILAGALSGGVTARPDKYPKNGNCVFMLVMDPAFFGGKDHFQAEVRQLLEYIRSAAPSPGHSDVILPGDPERKQLATCQEMGIEFDQGNWEKLTELAAEMGVSQPSTIAS